MNDELGGIISEETVLMGLWGEEARRDMLEYSERVTKTADHRIKVADLNWFRSDGVASNSGLNHMPLYGLSSLRRLSPSDEANKEPHTVHKYRLESEQLSLVFLLNRF